MNSEMLEAISKTFERILKSNLLFRDCIVRPQSNQTRLRQIYVLDTALSRQNQTAGKNVRDQDFHQQSDNNFRARELIEQETSVE